LPWFVETNGVKHPLEVLVDPQVELINLKFL